jgi:phosphoribosylamine---glycine ligase
LPDINTIFSINSRLKITVADSKHILGDIMNILVIGSGGREHAIINSLRKSILVNKLYTSSTNAGILQQAEPANIDIKHHDSVINFCKQFQINLVVIGPEDPLVNGLSDDLRQNDILVFGPSKQAARLEGSKIFAKKFMQAAQVPTAKSLTVNNVHDTLQAAKSFLPPYILKADGLAAGKGVFICKTLNELEYSAKQIFENNLLGSAGREALLEENLATTANSYEISFLILTNGDSFEVLPLAQDHKRLLDNNQGPNTGGMGTVAPMTIPTDLYKKIIDRVVLPSVNQLKKDQLLFRGVLFIGLMIVDNEPYALEYNVRFGDPETQVILPLISNDIAQVFFRLAQGELEPLVFNQLSAVCVVNASASYPESTHSIVEINLPSLTAENKYVLHAATKKIENKIFTNGGRVLNIIGLGNNFEEAKKNAYHLNEKVFFQGRQFRTDIGNYQSQRSDN